MDKQQTIDALRSIYNKIDAMGTFKGRAKILSNIEGHIHFIHNHFEDTNRNAFLLAAAERNLALVDQLITDKNNRRKNKQKKGVD